MISGFSRNRKDLTRAVRLDFQTKRGDTFFYEFDTYYVDENGEEVGYDFDGCSLKMHIKKKPTDKKPYIVVPVTAVNNTIRISLQQNVMNDTKADMYYYDVEIFDRDGNNYTILYGNFKILQDVTNWGDTSIIEFGVKDKIGKIFGSWILLYSAYLTNYINTKIFGNFLVEKYFITPIKNITIPINGIFEYFYKRVPIYTKTFKLFGSSTYTEPLYRKTTMRIYGTFIY